MPAVPKSSYSYDRLLNSHFGGRGGEEEIPFFSFQEEEEESVFCLSPVGCLHFQPEGGRTGAGGQ